MGGAPGGALHLLPGPAQTSLPRQTAADSSSCTALPNHACAAGTSADSGLSGGAIAGIIICVLVVCVLVGGIVVYIKRKHLRRQGDDIWSSNGERFQRFEGTYLRG